MADHTFDDRLAERKRKRAEEKAFQIILQDFWKTKPSNNNWKLKFSETFSMTVEEFYLKLRYVHNRYY